MSKKQEGQKLFVIRKYIMARNAKEALKKDLTTPADDVWIDNDWQKNNLASAIGFTHYPQLDEED